MCNHRQHATTQPLRPHWNERVRCNNTTLVRSTGKPQHGDYFDPNAKRPPEAYSPKPFYNFNPLETIYGFAEDFPADHELRNSMEESLKARGTVGQVTQETLGDLRAVFNYRAGEVRGKIRRGRRARPTDRRACRSRGRA